MRKQYIFWTLIRLAILMVGKGKHDHLGLGIVYTKKYENAFLCNLYSLSQIKRPF